jgi:D-serine deaminase-like pyridoxal phosphate-dependent protein
MTTLLPESWLASRPVEALPIDPPVPLGELPTPALLLDEAALDRNIAHMAAHLARHGKGVRPHAKTHKCPLIARRQIAHGAVGVCAAKVSEAFVLRRSGIANVLVTSPIVDRLRTDLVARLAGDAPGLMVVVDSVASVECLESSLERAGAMLDVLIDLDPRMGRTGVREPDDVYRLADRLARGGRLTLCGVQHYCGHVMHVEGWEARRQRSLDHWARASAICEGLRVRGHRVDVVSGGGTGTFDIDVEVDAVTDLQVGSYALMDEQYRVIGGRGTVTLDDFEVALRVATTAISQPAAGAVTVDCGFKGFASESIAPVAIDVPGAKYRFAGDEHGVLVLAAGGQSPRLGDRVEFIAPHCDPTVNLYDYYWVHRDGFAHALWPITARGGSW